MVYSSDPATQTSKTVTVQLLTQADFDGMSDARKAFIRDRIAAGQVKIVTPEELVAASKPKPTTHRKTPPDGDKNQKPVPTIYVRSPPPPPPSPIQRLGGKPVKIVLMSGDIYLGTLTEIYTYELIVVLDGAETIVAKHAIATIGEDKSVSPECTPGGLHGGGRTISE